MAFTLRRSELLPGQRRIGIGPIAADIGLIGWFIFSLFPIVWMVILALKNAQEQTTTYFQFSPTWSNFATVVSDKGTQMTSVDFKTSLLTSLINCGGAVIVSLLIGIPAAYAAGRWKYARCSSTFPMNKAMATRATTWSPRVGSFR